MNFDVFDKSEIEKYEEEVKAKWSNTKAYQEYMQKDIARDKEGYGKLADEMMTMFSELGKLKHLSPDAHEVQEKISALQQFITDALRTTLTRQAGPEPPTLSDRLLSLKHPS